MGCGPVDKPEMGEGTPLSPEEMSLNEGVLAMEHQGRQNQTLMAKMDLFYRKLAFSFMKEKANVTHEYYADLRRIIDNSAANPTIERWLREAKEEWINASRKIETAFNSIHLDDPNFMDQDVVNFQRLINENQLSGNEICPILYIRNIVDM